MSLDALSEKPAMEQKAGRPDRDWMKAVWLGLRERCPSCGQGHLFARYLKVRDHCSNCGEELHHHRADDAPPYFTIFLVGHIVVPLVLAVERTWEPAMWIHMALWLPLTLFLSLLLLPRMKGAIVGLQWALKMHGFAYASRREKSPASKDISSRGAQA